MSVQIRYQCGHVADWHETQRPQCPVCGETKKAGIIARPPTFRGSVRGPLAMPTVVSAVAFPLGTKE